MHVAVLSAAAKLNRLPALQPGERRVVEAQVVLVAPALKLVVAGSALQLVRGDTLGVTVVAGDLDQEILASAGTRLGAGEGKEGEKR